MIYTKVSATNTECSLAEILLEIPDMLGYVKKNLADRQFVSFTDAMQGIAFFTDTLFMAPTLNNEGEHVLGLYLWEGDENYYIGMYFYEVADEFNHDSVIWICFEEPNIN